MNFYELISKLIYVKYSSHFVQFVYLDLIIKFVIQYLYVCFDERFWDKLDSALLLDVEYSF